MAASVYFRFESCCTGEVLYFQGPTNLGDVFWTGIFPTLPTVLIYDPGGIFGPNFGLTSKSCYYVTSEVGDGSAYPTLLSGWMSTTDARRDCLVDGELFSECKPCPCYLIVTCDGSLAPFTTTQDLSAYVGQSVVLEGVIPSDFPEKCVQVILAPPNIQCDSSAVPLTYIEDCECPCNCYTVIANSKDCYYVDCDGNFQTTGPLTGTLKEIPCASTTPWVEGNNFPSPIYIENIGPCINGECPTPCYKLVDCEGIKDPIYTTKPSLGQYAIIGQIVKIQGYDTCWIVADTEECECAIDVVVTFTYNDCETCKNPSKYKLTNCDDSGTIVYTSSDLSPFVGQVIRRGECPGCWLVEEIEYIPSDVVVTVSAAFIDCEECGREYYKLTDCTGYKDPIYTYTDLTQYIGSVIKIKYCPETCWLVETSQTPTNSGIVIPETEFEDCEECLLTFPCICTTVRNDSTTEKEYSYYDCRLDIQEFVLLPGEKSEKFCIRVWKEYYPQTDYIETYGDCTQETIQSPWLCPPPVYKRRSVQPGYNTPVCSIEKYEKITCKASEAYYKQVLQLRYGISNCCPEEDLKWTIKKELIDLDALRDPDYVCTEVNSCCPTSSCSGTCNCSPTITTCNS